ncbi:MAG TPA: GNAT family protein [Candidatus Elarobacter sp.]
MSVRLETERLLLREPEDGDVPALLLYYQFNEDRFARWEPERLGGLAEFQHWVRWRRTESEAGRGRSFLAFDRTAPDALVAVVNLYDIRTLAIHMAILGYSLDGAYEGRGVAREAVEAVIAYAFGTLNLHRLEANYQPANERSGALLRRLGFVVEGYARDMIFLRGTWRDHIRTSLTNPSWKRPETTAPA